ncbi:MAG: hypothetical protein N2560_03150 [Ignavibacteria bacterium]|nr:hypothetical protein [Ignavibacteria bacterium]
MVFKLKIVPLILVFSQLFTFAKERVNPFKINNIEISYNFPINQISSSFFDSFNKYSNSNSSEFIFRNYPSVSLNIEFPGLTNVVLNFEWIRLDYSTQFNQTSNISYSSVFRSFNENFEFHFFPISFSFFFSPFNTDFKSLLHFQFGVSIDNLKWNEFVSSNSEDDPLKGLKTTNLKHFSPFFAFGVRNVLPFDIIENEQLLDNFFFEAKFYFFYRNVSIFKRIANSGLVDEEVTILPFSIVFLFGVNLNTRSFFLN